MTAVYHILAYNENYCNIEEFAVEIVTHCVKTSECEWDKVSKRLSSQSMALALKANNIIAVLIAERPTEIDQMHDLASRIAFKLAEVLDSAILFSETHTIKDKKKPVLF